MIKHPTKPIAVHEWDWKAQPDWDAISNVIAEFQNTEYFTGLKITEIETGSDSYAIVISSKDLTNEDARRAYESHYDWEDDKDPELLDWKAAQEHLKDVRLKYFRRSTLGFDYTEREINPILLRIAKGERTFDLFESIMNLK